jgi:hypothetical protein
VTHTRKIFIRYFLEMLGGFVLFGMVLTFRDKVEPSMHTGLLRTLVVASPLVPFLVVVWAVVRQFRRLDEYGRLMSLQSIAIAFGVTMGWAFAYGFLEDAGFPRFGMLSVWCVGMSTWAIVALVRGIASR